MNAAIVSEFRKLFSTRIWWILALVLVLYLGFIAAFMGFLMSQPEMANDPTLPGSASSDLALSVYSLANPIGYAFPLIVGSLMFTGEFRHRTITPSLLAGPNRTVLLAAKLLVSLVVGAIYGVLAVGATVGAAAPFLEVLGDGAHLTHPEVWKGLLSIVLVYALWSALGVVLGGLIVNQVAAIVVILVMTQFVEPLVRMGLAFWEPTAGVSRFLPAAAADSVVGATFMGAGLVDLLSRPVGVAVLCAYIAAFAVFARVVTLQRDIG